MITRGRASAVWKRCGACCESHHARPVDQREMAMRAAPMVDAAALVINLVDHEHRVRWRADRRRTGSRSPLTARCPDVRSAWWSSALNDDKTDGFTMWVPLLDGSERMGVPEVVAGNQRRHQRTATMITSTVNREPGEGRRRSREAVRTSRRPHPAACRDGRSATDRRRRGRRRWSAPEPRPGCGPSPSRPRLVSPAPGQECRRGGTGQR